MAVTVNPPASVNLALPRRTGRQFLGKEVYERVLRGTPVSGSEELVVGLIADVDEVVDFTAYKKDGFGELSVDTTVTIDPWGRVVSGVEPGYEVTVVVRYTRFLSLAGSPVRWDARQGIEVGPVLKHIADPTYDAYQEGGTLEGVRRWYDTTNQHAMYGSYMIPSTSAPAEAVYPEPEMPIPSLIGGRRAVYNSSQWSFLRWPWESADIAPVDDEPWGFWFVATLPEQRFRSEMEGAFQDSSDGAAFAFWSGSTFFLQDVIQIQKDTGIFEAYGDQNDLFGIAWNGFPDGQIILADDRPNWDGSGLVAVVVLYDAAGNRHLWRNGVKYPVLGTTLQNPSPPPYFSAFDDDPADSGFWLGASGPAYMADIHYHEFGMFRSGVAETLKSLPQHMRTNWGVEWPLDVSMSPL